MKGFKAMPSNVLDLATNRNVNQDSIREMTTRKQVSFDQLFHHSLDNRWTFFSV